MTATSPYNKSYIHPCSGQKSLSHTLLASYKTAVVHQVSILGGELMVVEKARAELTKLIGPFLTAIYNLDMLLGNKVYSHYMETLLQ